MSGDSHKTALRKIVELAESSRFQFEANGSDGLMNTLFEIRLIAEKALEAADDQAEFP